MLCAGAVGFGGANAAIGRIQQSQEQASDRAKDLRIARSIAAQAAGGAGVRQFATIQSVLPNDQILVYRGSRVVFAGPPVTGSAFELEVTSAFPGGRVVLRDYHSPVPGSSLGLTLVVGGWVLLVILAALVAAWWLTRAMQAPIGRAVAAADRVAAGDFAARIGAVSPDEFARLAKAFDSMAARLEAVDRDQRRFLADVAHEIATPVSAISGLAGALADGTLATYEQRAEAAGLIDTQVRRLGSLLEDLRRLTHLDLAEPVRWEDVDVAELCRSVRARFVPAAALAGVELSVEAEHHQVTADPRLLETILDNLVSNAIRYTPAGGSVRVRATQAARALVVSVTDTGIGIAGEDLERIFDRFYRVDRARDRATGGSGLGLSLARRSAQALGARIEVSSQPGRGSDFRLVLPTRRVASSHPESGAAPPSSDRTGEASAELLAGEAGSGSQ
jgi:signal transduction histidine kinase